MANIGIHVGANLANYTVIAGHRACRSVENIAVLVGRLPLRLAATVLHTAVLQTADDRLAVDRRADVGH